jgi:phosphomethylpyrimidine synthase
MTIHAGVLKRHIPLVKNRLIGIVSGRVAARQVDAHHNRKENPMYDIWETICDVMREYDVSFSIGDGLRPGGLADATDEAQLLELEDHRRTDRARLARGVQVMVEGPGMSRSTRSNTT